MRLLLADDHTLFRDALVQYIERAQPDANVTVAEDFNVAMELLRADPEQDLVLLDLRMPGMNGLGGFKKIREEFSDVTVALMSGVAEPEDVKQAMALGAVGYFPKTMSGKALLSGIQQVLGGQTFVPMEQNANRLMPSYKADHDPRGQYAYVGLAEDQQTIKMEDSDLTPREMDVMEFLMQGASNKEIANALGLQVVTVKLHVRGICKKLEAKNRTQAALIARERGWTERKSG